MADTNETIRASDHETAEKSIPLKSETKKDRTKTKNRSTNFWSYISLVISIVALAGTAYIYYSWYYQIEPKNARQVQEMTMMNDRINTVQKGQNEMETSLQQQASGMNEIQQSSNEMSESLTVVRDDLNTLATTVKKQSASISGDWYLEEVIQLLLLGDQRLFTLRDVDAAISVRKMASNQLEQLRDARYSVARRTLAEEIALLEQVETFDETEISLTLLGYATAVSNMPFRNERMVNSVETEEKVGTEQSSTASKSIFKEILGDFQQFVVVKKSTDSFVPTLDDNQKIRVIENLRLHLVGAQLALMQQRSKIYQIHIQEAVELTKMFLSDTAPGVVKFLADLQKLEQLPVGQQELPDVSGSLEILKRIQKESSDA